MPSFDHTLNAWNVSAVTNMNRMFYSAEAHSTKPSQLLERLGCNWHAPHVLRQPPPFMVTPQRLGCLLKVTDMSGMFFTKPPTSTNPSTTWDVSSVTAMAEMFSRATSFDQNLGQLVCGAGPTSSPDCQRDVFHQGAEQLPGRPCVCILYS